MSSDNEFKPGLEGVVAVETEIAEPDREGARFATAASTSRSSSGTYPYENVWGLLVDDDIDSTMPEPEPYEPRGADRQRPGRPPGRDGQARGRLEARQAERDLRRAGARGPRPALRADDGHRRPLGADRGRQDRPVPADVVAEGKTAAEQFLLRWRGEADPTACQGDRHVLDLHRRARAERVDVRSARYRLDRCGLRRRAVVRGRGAVGPAARRGAGVREADARRGRRDGRRREVGARHARPRQADHGLRPPHVPRRGSALAHPQADGAGARLGAASRSPSVSSRRRSQSSSERHPERRARDQCRVLLGSGARRGRDPAAARSRDVRVLARRRLVGAHPRAEANGPAVPAERARYVGPPERSLADLN